MPSKLWGVNKKVYLMGFVSLLTDISSEAIFAVFSLFFTAILGASTALLGIIEGLADFSASSLDYLAGYLADKTGKNKPWTAVGYGFSTIAKVFLVFANTVLFAAAFRVIERLGKSFRGPPRDAWLSSLTTDANRGISFGIHKALDKSGAIIGPLLAYFILNRFGQTAGGLGILFKVALIPATLAVILLLFISEKKTTTEKKEKRENIFNAYKSLGAGYKHYLYSAGIFSLAYFSFAFLLLKAHTVGFQIKDIVLLYVLFNLAFVLASVPIGKLGDRIGRIRIIGLGYTLYFMMSLGFIFATTRREVISLFVLFGIFYAIDEGQSKAYISDLEKEKRGTAIGLYNFITGMIFLPASVIAGLLWRINPNYVFIFAAMVSLIALVFFLQFKLFDKPQD